MLKFNPKRIFELRGIEKPVGFLVKLGFDYPQASRFLQARSPMLKIRHIERLCVALNCTPNDLFEWSAGKDEFLPDAHSLKILEKDASAKSLREMVKDVPSDRLAELEALVEQLKSQ